MTPAKLVFSCRHHSVFLKKVLECRIPLFFSTFNPTLIKDKQLLQDERQKSLLEELLTYTLDKSDSELNCVPLEIGEGLLPTISDYEFICKFISNVICLD